MQILWSWSFVSAEFLNCDDTINNICSLKFSSVYTTLAWFVFKLTLNYKLLSVVMLSKVRKLSSASLVFSGKHHKKSSPFNNVLSRECVVIQSVDSVDESQPFRILRTRCSAFPWSNVLLSALIIGVTLLLISPVIVFYLPRDLLGLDELRDVLYVVDKASSLSEVSCV